MKSLVLAAALAAAPLIGHCQTTAVNFTANDCSGTSHSLFTELDNGKTVVLVWVMPCYGCVMGAHVADSIVARLNTTNPGKAILWAMDDGVSGDCTMLSTWVGDNHVGHPLLFANAANEIDQDNYGGYGMPHIVVIGPDRYIYYNEKGSTGIGLSEAIDNAIHTRAAVSEVNTATTVQLTPNPAKNELGLHFQQRVKNIAFVTADGKTIRQQTFDAAVREPSVNIADLPAGIYVVRATTTDGQTITQKFVKE